MKPVLVIKILSHKPPYETVQKYDILCDPQKVKNLINDHRYSYQDIILFAQGKLYRYNDEDDDSLQTYRSKHNYIYKDQKSLKLSDYSFLWLKQPVKIIGNNSFKMKTRIIIKTNNQHKQLYLKSSHWSTRKILSIIK